MSHDQRPGRIRVVQDGRAPGGQAPAGGKAAAAGTAGPASSAIIDAAPQSARPAGLPIIPALLFLVACAIGGGLGAFLLARGL